MEPRKKNIKNGQKEKVEEFKKFERRKKRTKEKISLLIAQALAAELILSRSHKPNLEQNHQLFVEKPPHDIWQQLEMVPVILSIHLVDLLIIVCL